MPKLADIIKERINQTEILKYLKLITFNRKSWKTVLKYPDALIHEFHVVVCNIPTNLCEKSITIVQRHKDAYGMVDWLSIKEIKRNPDLQFTYEKFFYFRDDDPFYWLMHSDRMNWKWFENKIKLKAVKYI